MYHRVGEANSSWERKYCVHPSQFLSHMLMLKKAGWHAIELDDFFAWLKGLLVLESRSFLLTFDDGYSGVHQYAAPILSELGWPATVFLVSKLIGQRDNWCHGENPSGNTYPLMDWNSIRDLKKKGFTFQSHTRTHPDLSTLSDGELEAELSGARVDLSNSLDSEVEYLAYPYGRYDERVLKATVSAGYKAAFSVQPGFNRQFTDLFRIRRLDVFGTDSATSLKIKMALGTNDGSFGKLLRYGLDRILDRVRNP